MALRKGTWLLVSGEAPFLPNTKKNWQKNCGKLHGQVGYLVPYFPAWCFFWKKKRLGSLTKKHRFVKKISLLVARFQVWLVLGVPAVSSTLWFFYLPMFQTFFGRGEFPQIRKNLTSDISQLQGNTQASCWPLLLKTGLLGEGFWFRLEALNFKTAKILWHGWLSRGERFSILNDLNLSEENPMGNYGSHLSATTLGYHQHPRNQIDWIHFGSRNSPWYFWKTPFVYGGRSWTFQPFSVSSHTTNLTTVYRHTLLVLGITCHKLWERRIPHACCWKAWCLLFFLRRIESNIMFLIPKKNNPRRIWFRNHSPHPPGRSNVKIMILC